MANPFVQTTATYTRTISDPRDGEEWQVTYRPLSAGDRAQLQDLARMSLNQDEPGNAGSAEMRLGAAQILTLERAIVSWTLPLSPTRDTISALHPDLFDEIFGHISWGSAPAEDPTPAPSEPSPGSGSSDSDEPS